VIRDWDNLKKSVALQGGDDAQWGTFSPDQRRVLTETVTDQRGHRISYVRDLVSWGGVVGWSSVTELWDTRSGRRITVLDQVPHGAKVQGIFSADSKYLVTLLGGDTARVWNAESGQALCTLRAHTDVIHAAAFHPDGRRVLTGSADRTLRIWDTQTGQELLSLLQPGEVTSVAISPDGRSILTTCGAEGEGNGAATLLLAADWKATDQPQFRGAIRAGKTRPSP
jgi:WD40 repeat protein